MTVKYQRVAFPLAYGGKVSLKVTYQGARSTPSIDKHWRARLAASPSPHNIHWQMKNKKRLKGTNMSEGDSTKRTFIMTGRKKRNEWPRVHAWVHSRWGEKEKTSKVVVFSFLVNEHISPGAEDGEVQGSREVVGGGRRRWRRRSSFDQPLGYVCVGDLDLVVAGAGVGELFARVGVVQVLPDARHLFGDFEASVLLSHHLKEWRESFNHTVDAQTPQIWHIKG